MTSIVEAKGLVGRARRVLSLGAAAAVNRAIDPSVNQSGVRVQAAVEGQGDDLEILGEACAEECYHWWLPTLPRMRDAQRTEIQDSMIDEYFQVQIEREAADEALQ